MWSSPVKLNYYCTAMLRKCFVTKHLPGLSINSMLLFPEKIITMKGYLTIYPKTFIQINHQFFHSSSLMQKEKKKSTKGLKLDLAEAKNFINTDKYMTQLDNEIEELKENFVKHLTIRSSVGSMNQIAVKFEGENYLLQEIVQVVYKPKMVVLDASSFPQVIPQVLESISKSGLNVNPQQDGTTVYIPIPKVTKEHRENLAKNAKNIYIKSRDKMKDIRNKQVKSLQNKPSISEDQVKRIHNQLNIVCDDYIKKADSILETKRKELLKTE